MVASLKLPATGHNDPLWLFFVACNSVVYYPSHAAYHRVFNAAGPCSVHVFPETNEFMPHAMIALYDEWALVVLPGSQGFHQLRQQAIMRQTTDAQFAGPVSAFYLAAANDVGARINPFLDAQLGNRKIVCVGHSYGAAVCTLLGPMLAARYPGALSDIVAFASPKAGSPQFARAYSWPHVGLVAEGDPIGFWPLTSLVNFIESSVRAPTAWEHVRRRWTLQEGGFLASFDLGQRRAANPEGVAIRGRPLIALEGFIPGSGAHEDQFAHSIWHYVTLIRQRLPRNLRTHQLPALHLVDGVLEQMADETGIPFRIEALRPFLPKERVGQ